MGMKGVTGLKENQGWLLEELNTSLTGIAKYRAYREMLENDDVIGAGWNAWRSTSLATPLSVQAGEGPNGEARASWFRQMWKDMSQSESDWRSETVYMVPYGFALQEPVHKIAADGTIGWDYFSPRSQDTILKWKFKNGQTVGCVQRDPNTYDEIPLNLNNLLHFRTESFKNNPEGRAALHGVWRCWRHKKRFEDLRGVAVERDITGIVHFEVPEDVLTDPTKAGLRAEIESLSEQVGFQGRCSFVTPASEFTRSDGVQIKSGWKVTAFPSPGKRMVDLNETIQQLSLAILRNWNESVLMLGSSHAGSYALSQTLIVCFHRSIEHIHRQIEEVMNQVAIPRLMRMNQWDDPTDWPRFRFEQVASNLDPIYLSYIKELTTLGYFKPDDQKTRIFEQQLGLDRE